MAYLRLWLNDTQLKEIQAGKVIQIGLKPRMRREYYDSVVVSGLTTKQRTRDKKLSREKLVKVVGKVDSRPDGHEFGCPWFHGNSADSCTCGEAQKALDLGQR